MLQENYRDSYTLVKLRNADAIVYSNTKIIFNSIYAYSEDGKCIGFIYDNSERLPQVEELISAMRNNGSIPTNTDTAIIKDNLSINREGIESGTAIATIDGFVIVYCGVLDCPDEDYESDEEYYSLTEEGLKYLEGLEALANIMDENICDLVCPTEEREEKNNMDNLFGNLGFGKITGNRFKLSMNGIAVSQGNGKYVVYNKDSNEFVDVTNTLFDFKDALFMLPAVEVSAGDTVIHENKAYFIVDTTNEIKAVSYEDCTQTVLIPKSTMFGIKYFTKVFSMFGDNFAATGDLFSNPMMLMALMDGKNSDLTQLMLFNSMSNGELGSNPMALAMMLKGDKSDDSLSTIALMSMFNNGTNPFAPKKKDKKAETTRSNN